ncbi:hypothetical protein [Cronobacter dublinensis]|uniref:hypothetical protein n=1 Tax=Cronobacter dublinensis TaxID=413497 RepID=UPI00131A2380|nr:hypothetical protein [Cronobacter dublinensis]
MLTFSYIILITLKVKLFIKIAGLYSPRVRLAYQDKTGIHLAFNEATRIVLFDAASLLHGNALIIKIAAGATILEPLTASMNGTSSSLKRLLKINT